jgi:hypothetical protein
MAELKERKKSRARFGGEDSGWDEKSQGTSRAEQRQDHRKSRAKSEQKQSTRERRHETGQNWLGRRQAKCTTTLTQHPASSTVPDSAEVQDSQYSQGVQRQATGAAAAAGAAATRRHQQPD